MNRSLGSASSIPGEGTPQTPMMEAARGGEAEPSDWSGNEGRATRAPMPRRRGASGLPRRAAGIGLDEASMPASLLPRIDSNLSNVQLALAHAHVAWAKRHAPHLLEEWLDD